MKIALLDSYVRGSPVLLTYLRFSDAVHSFEGSEVQKYDKAARAYETKFADKLLRCSLTGGGPKGVRGVILSYV